jgi:hypothetical protein
MKLYIDLNGRIACIRHIGAYAQTILARNPAQKTIKTPITEWALISKDFEREFKAQGFNCQCEACLYQ